MIREEYERMMENIEVDSDWFWSSMNREEKRCWVYSRGYYDIWWFAWYHLEKRKGILQDTNKKLYSPWFHEEIWEFLDGDDDVNLIEPRWHAKTTAVIIYILHAICYEKYYSIAYIAPEKLGTECIGKLRKELELNESLIWIFGDLVPVNSDDVKDKRLRKWRWNEIELLNGVYVGTVSKGQSFRWSRPELILVDDPQENKDVRNKRVVDEFNDWVLSTLYGSIVDDIDDVGKFKMVVVGTVISELCLVKELQRQGWRTIERSACDENMENLLRPEKRSKEMLMRKKKKMWSALFNQEYRHIPMKAGERLVKSAWIKYWENLPKRFDRIIMSVDPAVKDKEANDYTGICVVGVKWSKVFVLYSEWYKLDPLANEKKIIELFKRFKPTHIVYETNKEYKLFLDLKKKGLPMKGVHASEGKRQRLMSIVWDLEFGEIFFIGGWRCEELIYQLTTFPDIKNDDVMDAFVYCMIYRNLKWNKWVLTRS